MAGEKPDWASDTPKDSSVTVSGAPDWATSRPGQSVFKRPGQPSFAQQMGGLAYGAGTELAGAPGEIEEFFTTSGKGEKLGGAGQVLPTAPEIRKGLKGTALEPVRGTEAMQKTGEVLASVGMLAPAAYRGVGKMVGSTTKEGERIAGVAEKLGFKLSPSQVRADAPVSEKGAAFYSKENQLLANRLVSKGTGVQADEVTGDFIKGRLKELGKEFDKVYRGKEFKIDPSVEPTLENILAREQDLGFAGVPAVKGAAQSILDNIATGRVPGEDIQRLRNALTEAARSAGSRGKAHEIYELVDVLDRAVENANPAMKATLERIRPQYRNTIILEDLYNSDGIKQGNVSLERLGGVVGDKNTLRRNPQDIDTYGELGRELGLRARWESAGGDIPELVEKTTRTHGPLSTAIRGLATPLRTRYARAAQRSAQRGSTGQKLGEALGTVPAIEEVISPRQR